MTDEERGWVNKLRAWINAGGQRANAPAQPPLDPLLRAPVKLPPRPMQALSGGQQDAVDAMAVARAAVQQQAREAQSSYEAARLAAVQALDPLAVDIIKRRAKKRPGVYLDIETGGLKPGVVHPEVYMLQLIELVKAGVVTQAEAATEMDRIRRLDMALSMPGYIDTGMSAAEIAERWAKLGDLQLHTTIVGPAAPPDPCEVRADVDAFELAAAELEADP